MVRRVLRAWLKKGAGDQAARASRGRAARSDGSISGPPRYGRLARMRRTTKRRVQLFLRLLLVGTLIGVAYGGLIGLTFRGTALINSLIGAIDGATITAVIAAVEIFLLRTRWGRPLQQAPFLVTFGVQWLRYRGVVLVVTAGNLRQRLLLPAL